MKDNKYLKKMTSFMRDVFFALIFLKFQVMKTPQFQDIEPMEPQPETNLVLGGGMKHIFKF